MKFAPLSVLLLLAAPNLVAAQSEVICPEGKSRMTKSLGLDEYIDYKTQDGAPGTDYTNKVNCNVQFKRKKGSDCELKFNCTHFDLKSAKPAPKCQDKMIISGQKYCQSTGPDVTVSGSKLKVAFKTNKKGTATGAVCTAYCVPPPPPPGTHGCPLYNQTQENNVGTLTKIIGGFDITSAEIIPWQVAIVDNDDEQEIVEPFCGGSIISNMWILSAAHCTEDYGLTKDDIQILRGIVNWNIPDIPRYDVAELVPHPYYNGSPNFPDYDFLLVKLQTSIMFDRTNQPICLPSLGSGLFVDISVFASGWGHIIDSETEVSSEILQAINVRTISNQICRNIAFSGIVTNQMICTVGNDIREICNGDSGGPLFQIIDYGQGIWGALLIGVNSWSEGICLEDPSGYARVSTVVPWIKKMTGIQ